MRDERSNHRICKLAYIGLWICLGFLCVYSLSRIGLPLGPFLLFSALCVVAALSCASYYFCCVGIWFIGKVSKMDALASRPVARWCPDLSPLLFDLRRLASRNSTVFLLVSLLFSVAILACVVIRGDAVGDSLFTFTLLAVLAIGYVTFAVLFVCSRIFINRLVARWCHNALAEIERAWAQDGERAALSLRGRICSFESCAKALGVGRRVSSKDLAAILLATATFAVNILTMALGLAV